MASVWIQLVGLPEQKLAGHLSAAEARARLQDGLQGWVVLKGNGYARGCDGYMTLQRLGQTRGILWIEWCSPPSRPEPGQVLRRMAR